MAAYDVIVIGVGGMGSAAAYHLAKRGCKVLGLDRFEPCHDLGSSHGETRIYRKAYFEHPDYVPLLIRAYALWDELRAASGDWIYCRRGLLLAGPCDGVVVAGVRRSADAYGLDVESLSPSEQARRYPTFNLPADRYDAVFEEDAGYLKVNECLVAHQNGAERHGAELLWGHHVQGWSADANSVRIATNQGDFTGGSLVICGGPWSESLLSDLGLPLTVRRKVQLWFKTQSAKLKDIPVFGVETPDGFFYGFPAIEPRLMKIAHHTGGQAVRHADLVDRELHDEDVRPVRSFIKAHLRGVTGEVIRYSVCLYTMTPDEHFIIDRHPEYSNVCFAAGFSGHGFKFCPIVGSILADLAIDGRTDEPIGFLAFNRPALRGS